MAMKTPNARLRRREDPDDLARVHTARPARRGRSGAIRLLLREATRVIGKQVAFVDSGGSGEVTWADVAASAALWEARFLTQESPSAGAGSSPAARDDCGRPVVGLRIAAPEIFCREYLAALAAGVCIVPIDPRCTQSDLDRYASSFRLTHLLSDGAEVLDLEAARRLRAGRPRPSGSVPAEPSRSEADSIVSLGGLADSLDLLAEPPAVLVRTSGSSGPPKLVPLTERQLVAVAAAVVDHQRLSPSDRGFAAVPLFDVDTQVVGILTALISGGSLAVEENFEPENFWSRVEAVGATWLSVSPAMIARLNDLPGPSEQVRRQVRFARTGLEALPHATHSRFFMQTGISVLETYTMAEAAGQVAANPLRVAERRPGSVGRPVGTKVRIVRDGIVPPGEPGHVEIQGVGVITSYLPEGRLGPPIEACDNDGWLDTGDVGWLDDAGYLFLAGQVDDVIEQAEATLYPREIEDVLVSVLGVVEAAVVGRQSSEGELPVAFVGTGRHLEPRADESLRRRIADTCAVKLALAQRPLEIVVAESLPFGPTGKVARKTLRKVLHCNLTGAA